MRLLGYTKLLSFFKIRLFPQIGTPNISRYYIQGQLEFRVLDWEECGVENSQCSTSNPCQHGYCSNASVCLCDLSFFWWDCSRGCSQKTTTIIEESGSIASDTPSFGLAPLYISWTNCSWFISPKYYCLFLFLL